MPRSSTRPNRDEFYAAIALHDDVRIRKILWTVYWRGNAQLRERIEDELRPQDQPKVKPKKELRDPIGVLAEMTTFVQLAKDGAYMEFVYAETVGQDQMQRTARFADAMKQVGYDHCIMATDLGGVRNPPTLLEPQGLLDFMKNLHQAGVSVADINRMSKTNPAILLGLPPN